MDGSWCSNHSAKKMSQWCMARVFDYLIQYVTLCNEINCVGKIWCRPFERYIDHFIPISSSWDMDQSFNIGTSLGRFFDSLYIWTLWTQWYPAFVLNSFHLLKWHTTPSFLNVILVNNKDMPWRCTGLIQVDLTIS